MMTHRNQPGRCRLPTRVEVALFCTEFLDGGERRVGFEVRDPDELEIRETYDGWPSEQAFREEFPDVAAIVAFVRAHTVYARYLAAGARLVVLGAQALYAAARPAGRDT